MDFAFTDEQELLRKSARAWLTDRYPIDRVVELTESPAGWEPASWREIAALGWLDPELGPLEYAVLFEELGRALYPGPLFGTVALAAPVLAAAGRPHPDSPVTLAVDDDPQRPVTVAGGRLTGVKRFVPDLDKSDEVVVAAAGALYRVPVAAGTVTVRSTVDRTRPFAEFELAGATGELLLEGEAAGAALADASRRARALLACEAVGAASVALELAVVHARQRTQFDRPIGSYQGVSHRLADSYVAVELARSLAYYASWAVAVSDAGAETACAAAKAAAGEGCVRACENAIQVMGGIGFTWDAPLHRYYKRTQWVEAFGGAARAQRAAIARTLLS